MEPVEVASLLRQEPFHPLRLHLSSGRVVPVTRPDRVHPTHHGVFLFTPALRGRGIMELEEIKYSLIDRIETLPPTPST